MKRTFLFFTFFALISSLPLEGQINFQGCTAEFGSTTYTLGLIGTTNDVGIIRNTFDTSPINGAQACNGFGFGFCEFRIIWDVANDEWLFQMTDGFSFFTIYSNNSASHPNPPDLSLGTWVENTTLTGGNCGGNGSSSIGTLSGDVQSAIVLPVELVYFEGVHHEEKITLIWKTASEKNNEKIEIEKSQNGREFQKIGEVEGKGTTLEQKDYSFEVKNPRNGISYYRLKQIDFDGQLEYSKVISVNFKGENGEIGEFYPNPSKSGLIQLDYTSQTDHKITVSVFDVTGKLVINEIQQVLNGDNNLSFDFSELDKGIYIVKIGDKNNPTYRKLIIER